MTSPPKKDNHNHVAKQQTQLDVCPHFMHAVHFNCEHKRVSVSDRRAKTPQQIGRYTASTSRLWYAALLPPVKLPGRGQLIL